MRTKKSWRVRRMKIDKILTDLNEEKRLMKNELSSLEEKLQALGLPLWSTWPDVESWLEHHDVKTIWNVARMTGVARHLANELGANKQ